MYQVNFRSKKYKAMRMLVPMGGRICIICGRMLSHPQSMMSHTGPQCLENQAKKQALKNKSMINDTVQQKAEKEFPLISESEYSVYGHLMIDSYWDYKREIEKLRQAFLAGYSLANERIKELEGALKELVELKDMHDRFFLPTTGLSERVNIDTEYQKRKPLAWDQARNVIKS